MSSFSEVFVDDEQIVSLRSPDVCHNVMMFSGKKIITSRSFYVVMRNVSRDNKIIIFEIFIYVSLTSR